MMKNFDWGDLFIWLIGAAVAVCVLAIVGSISTIAIAVAVWVWRSLV